MEVLKKADFYRKYKNEEQRTQTVLGACFSLLSLLLMLVLVIFEVTHYLYPHLNRSVVINKSYSGGDTLPFNLDIAFPKMPCKCLQLLKRDSFGVWRVNFQTETNIKLLRLDTSGKAIQDSYIAPEIATRFPKHPPATQAMFTQLFNNEGCRVMGALQISKSPGFVQFYVNLNQADLIDAQVSLSDVAPKLEFSHTIYHVSFGSQRSQWEISVKMRRDGPHLTEFNKASKAGPQRNVNSCYYYMKAVPHWFVLGSQKDPHETYQYSLDYTCDNSAKTIGGYQIALVYDMSAVGIVYTKEQWSILQVLVSASAIVAGVYVVMRNLYSVAEYVSNPD